MKEPKKPTSLPSFSKKRSDSSLPLTTVQMTWETTTEEETMSLRKALTGLLEASRTSFLAFAGWEVRFRLETYVFKDGGRVTAYLWPEPTSQGFPD